MGKRVVWIVLDSVGIGELPDAADFGDEGAYTLAHTWDKNKGLNIPNMIKLGLGNIDESNNIPVCNNPIGCYAKAAEMSNGKDTTVGHWEMAGVYSPNRLPTYPDGFDKNIIDKFIAMTGVPGVLGNCVASGTEIIKKLGREHLDSMMPIVYTSADSVFQIACHEDIYSPDRLYEMCKIARGILVGENGVARVIARPFIGSYPDFKRTSNRRDFSLEPDKNNILEKMKSKGYDVIAVGKIEDIFAKSGITEAVHTKDNQDGIDKTIEYLHSLPIKREKIVLSKILAALIYIVLMVLLITLFNFAGLKYTGEFDEYQFLLLSLTPLFACLPLFGINLLLSTFTNKTKKMTGVALGITFASYTLLES